MLGWIKKSVAEVLDVSKCLWPWPHESWHGNEEVQIIIKAKRELLKVTKATDKEAFEEYNYNTTKWVPKKAISKARGDALDGLYQKLGTQEVERELFKLARLKRRRART